MSPGVGIPPTGKCYPPKANFTLQKVELKFYLALTGVRNNDKFSTWFISFNSQNNRFHRWYRLYVTSGESKLREVNYLLETAWIWIPRQPDSKGWPPRHSITLWNELILFSHKYVYAHVRKAFLPCGHLNFYSQWSSHVYRK